VEPSWSPRAKDDVIRDIEARIHRYFVEGKDAQGNIKRISIFVVDDPNGKYLRTGPDPETENNLHELPKCLPTGSRVVSNPVRRNVATVSQAERDKLRDAILALNKKKYQDLVSYWFKQDQIHQATHVHEGPAFLPWHRELVNRFEALLQEVDPTVVLHYWDWQTDPRSSPDRRGGTVDLFTEGFMGSPGLPDEEQRVGKPFDEESGFDNGGVIAGSRSDSKMAKHPPLAQYPPRQITRQVAAGTPRNFNARDLEGREGDGGHHDIGSDYDIIETRGRVAEQYQLMRLRMEAEHNWVHEYIGGTIGGDELGAAHSAFEDPFVFLLHSNVDRLWASWQLRPVGDMKQVSRRLDPEQVYGNEGDTERAPETVSPRVEGIMTPMEPWAGNASLITDFNVTILPWCLQLKSPSEPTAEEKRKMAQLQTVVKNSKDPSVVRPPLYDEYVLIPLNVPSPEGGQLRRGRLCFWASSFPTVTSSRPPSRTTPSTRPPLSSCSKASHGSRGGKRSACTMQTATAQ
jgi:hypothetical protein